MRFDPSSHLRRSIRFRDWDYSANGAYFVTLVTQDRASLFGNIVDGEMRLNEMGAVACACWEAIPDHFTYVEVDVFVIMPNHVHGIVLIVGATDSVAPTTPSGPPRGSLGAIIGQYKSVVTKKIRKMANAPNWLVWQRNYYERIIRNERELIAVREYIMNNPVRWAEDAENRQGRPIRSPDCDTT